jgi:hypothetical protein
VITRTADGRYRVECAENPCLRPLLGRVVGKVEHARNLERKHWRELHADLEPPSGEVGPEPDEVAELAAILDAHLTDRMHESGCRLSCGYDGDEVSEHIAAVILAAGYAKPPM